MGFPVQPVLTRKAPRINHPQVKTNEVLLETEHPVAGRIRQARPAAQFSARPFSTRQGAPKLVGTLAEVLSEIGLNEGGRATNKQPSDCMQRIGIADKGPELVARSRCTYLLLGSLGLVDFWTRLTSLPWRLHEPRNGYRPTKLVSFSPNAFLPSAPSSLSRTVSNASRARAAISAGPRGTVSATNCLIVETTSGALRSRIRAY